MSNSEGLLELGLIEQLNKKGNMLVFFREVTRQRKGTEILGQQTVSKYIRELMKNKT